MGEMAPVMLRIRKGFAFGLYAGYDVDFGFSIGITLGVIVVMVDFRKRRMKTTPLFEFVNEWNYGNGRS